MRAFDLKKLHGPHAHGYMPHVLVSPRPTAIAMEEPSRLVVCPAKPEAVADIQEDGETNPADIVEPNSAHAPPLAASSSLRSFKDTVPFEKRAAEARSIREANPGLVPIICEKHTRSTLLELENKRFLVSGGKTCMDFNLLIHKTLQEQMPHRQQLRKGKETIYFLIGNVQVKSSSQISELYATYKDDDGFLYISYTSETVFGEKWSALRLSVEPQSARLSLTPCGQH